MSTLGILCNANRGAYWSFLTHSFDDWRPDPPTQFILYVLDWFMAQGEAGQGKRLTLFSAWNYVIIYVLCEALHCHAGKCQVRYFARNDLLSFVHELRKDEH